MSLLRHLPRFRSARHSLQELAARESWSREQIAAYQLSELNQLWRSAIQDTPYYRDLARSLALPQEFDSLNHFQSACPILDKNLVRTRQREFLSERSVRGKWYHSGGSTGKPTSYFRSNKAHLEILQGRYRAHEQWGVDLFDRWAFLWGHGASFSPGIKGLAEKLKQPVVDWLRNRCRLSAYDLSSQSLREQLRRIDRFRPAAIYGYSTAVYLIAKEAKAVGFHCPSLKIIVMTAEPVYPLMVKECEEAFGVPALIEYGSAETNTVAFEWPDRTLRVRDDLFFVETPLREDGRYDIVLTVLNSSSFPLVRYAIGDTTDSPLQRPDIGLSFLRNIAGRRQDLVIARNGQPIYAGWFEEVLEHLDPIRRYQVHQQSTGELIVRLELKDPQTFVDQERIKKVFSERSGFEVNVSIVEELPSTLAGKHRWISSDLATEKNMLLPS